MATEGQGTIFRDKEKLSPRYIPETLPHREKQIEELYRAFSGALASPSRAFLKPVQIIGPAGSGKTSCISKFGEKLQKEAAKAKRQITHVYVNLKLQGGSRVVLYRYLVERAAPEFQSTGYSAEEMLRMMLKELRESKRYLLISLDEIDYFLKSSKEGASVVYDLTRLNEIEPDKPCNVLGVVFTARSREFHERLDAAELSTLGRIPMEFPPYTAPQMTDILRARVKEAFQPGAVSDDVLDYVADISVGQPVNGDVRYALDLLLLSGNLAENSGSDRVLPDHVRMVHGRIHPSITEEDILNLPKKEHLLALLAVARSLKSNRMAYATMKDIRLNCGVICEERKMKPIEDLDEYLQDLSDRGIIEIPSLRDIGVSGVQTENLEQFLNNLLNRLESGLEERK